MANHDAPEATNDIRALVAHLLAGVTRKPEAHWEKLIGEVTALPTVFHPRSNLDFDVRANPVHRRPDQPDAGTRYLAYKFLLASRARLRN